MIASACSASLSDSSQRFHPVDPGKADIQRDEIRIFFLSEADALLVVHSEQDLV
tara:strand:- start:2344 stop:2505 length:162 start_codon:yes stop_codon:yes gene_type:complete